jgi:acyl-homoserine-lactone acylase
MTGGESGDPASPHFNDQAQMYCEGRFRDVWFSRQDVMAHARRRYHPGEL